MQAIDSARNYLFSTWSDVWRAVRYILHDLPTVATILVLALPWMSLLLLRDNFGWIDQIGGALAITFSFWWMSRSGAAPAPAIKKPRLEFLFAIALIFLWVEWRIGICAKLFFFLPTPFNCYQSAEFETAPKVIEQVIFPFAVLYFAGYRLRAQGLDWNWRAWWVSLPTLVAIVGYAIYLHWGDLPKLGQRSMDFFLAAGLPEEFLFRSILLTRLEAWWKSPAWAVFGSAAIFGLTHLPIDYLVFTRNNMSEAWITLLTFQMGLGAVFAFAYQRTRSVWPIALIHAVIDAI